MMATLTGLPILYRYVDGGMYSDEGRDQVAIRCERWVAYRQTRAGYWVIPWHMQCYWLRSHAKVHSPEWRKAVGARWVGSHKADRHWCYLTQSQAWESYRKRKEWHIRHLTQALERTKLLLQACNTLHPAPQQETTYFTRPVVRGFNHA